MNALYWQRDVLDNFIDTRPWSDAPITPSEKELEEPTTSGEILN